MSENSFFKKSKEPDRLPIEELNIKLDLILVGIPLPERKNLKSFNFNNLFLINGGKLKCLLSSNLNKSFLLNFSE